MQEQESVLNPLIVIAKIKISIEKLNNRTNVAEDQITSKVQEI